MAGYVTLKVKGLLSVPEASCPDVTDEHTEKRNSSHKPSHATVFIFALSKSVTYVTSQPPVSTSAPEESRSRAVSGEGPRMKLNHPWSMI